MKPTPEVTQALANLRVSSDFKTVLDWIAGGLADMRDTCEKHTADEKLYRAQGSCQSLRAILETNRQAPELLEKFKTNPPKN